MGLVRLAGLPAGARAGALAAVFTSALLAFSCASSGAVPRPFPEGPATRKEPEASAPRRVPGAAPVDPALVTQTALRLRGVPYRNGGSDPKGFDCSGLVQYVFAQHGIVLPRAVRDQLQLGREVRLAGIEPGDLIFFGIASTEASHVGVAIGGDEFVHAPSSRGVVRVEKFSAPYWGRRIVSVRRIR